MNERRQELYLRMIKRHLSIMLANNYSLDQTAMDIFYKVVLIAIEDENQIREQLELLPKRNGH